MTQDRVRLAIKLSAITTLMVVATAVGAFLTSRFIVEGYVTLWVALFSLFSLGLGLLLTLFLDRTITIPIESLVQQTRQMVAQDYRLPISLQTSDEIAEMGRALEALRRSFLTQRDALRELNRSLDRRVEERTSQLETALEDLRAAQERLIRTEKLASIGHLAGGLAHEINNPAAIILTRVGLLMDWSRELNLDEDFVEGLEVISRQVGRMSRITQDLLTFSRLSPMDRGPIDLSEILNMTTSLISYEAKVRKVHIETHITPGVFITGDKDRLEQVCLNLIKNALDAMEEEGGALILSLEPKGGEAVMTIEDTGAGVEVETLKHIFDPFFTTKGAGKGTGLGLSISYGILEELGGNITATNRAEGGARFSITLPLEKEREGEGDGDV